MTPTHHIAVHMFCHGRTDASRSRVAFELKCALMRQRLTWNSHWSAGIVRRAWRDMHTLAITLYTMGSE